MTAHRLLFLSARRMSRSLHLHFPTAGFRSVSRGSSTVWSGVNRQAACASAVLATFAILAAGRVLADEGTADAVLHLNLRTRVELNKGSDEWHEVVVERELPAERTAILICDMWDKHWCPSATQRCGEMAERMAPIIDRARAAGIAIIHAPSETMDFYAETPQRQRVATIPRVTPPKPLDLSDPPLPIDDSDGGCEDASAPVNFRAWTRQHPAIPIAGDDIITDDGDVVYSYLRQRGIDNLIVMGVHTNMCVLGRPFGIRQMTRWGIRCVLVRDLTDAMYNPAKHPYVSHDEGTQLVVEHIEKHWCPSVLSADLVPVTAAKRQ